MFDLIVYLAALCQCQADQLSAAHAVIREQAAALDDVDGLIASLENDIAAMEADLFSFADDCPGDVIALPVSAE